MGVMMWLSLATLVAILIVVARVAFVPWSWRDVDWEHVRGVLVLAVVAIALGTAALTIWGEWQAWHRVGLAAAAMLTATFIASTNWTRRSLRAAAAIGALVVVLVVADIGRDAPSSQADRSLRALDSSLDKLVPFREQKRQELASARTKALATLAESIAVVRPENAPLAERADAIRNDLVTGADQETLTGHLSKLDAIYASASATDSAKKLRADVDKTSAAVAAAADPPSNAAARRAIESGERCVGGSTCPDGLEVALAIARLRVAAYRSALLEREEDAAEVKTATAELAAARAAAGGSESQRTLQNALGDGVDEIASSLPFQDRGRALALDVLGWLAVSAVLLALWRSIERRSADQMPGPVQTNFNGAKAPSDAASEDEAAQKATFRAALLQNLPEPAATPGAEAFSSVTDLAELGGKTTPIARFFSALKGIVVRPGGYVATADVIPPLTKGDDWAVLVRIDDEWTDEQVAVKRITGKTAMTACNAAGFWTAASVLSRSSRIPSWARWDDSTAEALGAYHGGEAIDDADLEAAVARAPSSGLLLHTLADRRELGGEYLEALTLYARSVAAHPRYPVARYRLAASLASFASFASTATKEWKLAPLSARVRVVEHVGRACEALHLDACALSAIEENPESQMSAIAKKVYDRIIDDNRWRNAIPVLFRKSERAFWWPRFRTMFHRFGPRAAGQWMAASAKLVLEKDASSPGVVQERASDRRSWWQLSYNLACYYAQLGTPSTALTWLETALQRPGSGQMGGGWLRMDPDLEPIRGEPRFEAVAAQLAPAKAMVEGEKNADE